MIPRDSERLAEVTAFSEGVSALGETMLAEEGAAGEKRDETGKWTAGGGAAKKPSLLKRIGSRVRKELHGMRPSVWARPQPAPAPKPRGHAPEDQGPEHGVDYPGVT